MNTLACLWLLVVFGSVVWSFDLTILHDNDVHGRVEQMDRFGGECSQQEAADGACYGGEARRATAVREIRNNIPNVLLLEAGDRFTGTVWFSYYKGEASAVFMNRLQYDATSFGNHEFDLGIDGLVSYLDKLAGPQVVAANIDITREPRLAGTFSKSIVLQTGGKQIGIVGYVLPETASMSLAGSTVTFLDEVSSVQAEVNSLKATGSIDIIIALGHSDYAIDQKIAREVDGVYIVVGGHTNTFLYSDKDTLDLIKALARPLDQLKQTVIGRTSVFLQGERTRCRLEECNLGTISYDDILATLPFGNTIDKISIAGKFLRQALEFSIEGYDPRNARGKFLQFSGLRVQYDLQQPQGKKVVSVDACCLQCNVPCFSPLKDDVINSVLLPSFLAQGGDGYTMFRDNRTNFPDIDIMKKYLSKFSPIRTGLEGRIKFITVTKSDAYDCPITPLSISYITRKQQPTFP